MSDGAFPSTTRSSRRAVYLHPSHPSLSASCSSFLSRGTRRFGAPPFEWVWPTLPRGPRSGSGYSVPIHLHLFGPIRPTRRHNRISPLSGLYRLPSLCVGLLLPYYTYTGFLAKWRFFRHTTPGRRLDACRPAGQGKFRHPASS